MFWPDIRAYQFLSNFPIPGEVDRSDLISRVGNPLIADKMSASCYHELRYFLEIHLEVNTFIISLQEFFHTSLNLAYKFVLQDGSGPRYSQRRRYHGFRYLAL
jgi:hypothetical protein